MKWFCMVMALVVGLAAGWAQAQEKKAESKAEQQKEYNEFKPGSDTTYNWVEGGIKAARDKMKEEKSPGLLYVYNPDDKRPAFFIEKHIFADSELSPVGGKFITVKQSSADEKELGDYKTFKGRTGVVFLAPTGKPLTPLIANKAAFKREADRIAKKFAPKEGEGEKKESTEKKDTGEKKEEGKQEKKEKE